MMRRRYKPDVVLADIPRSNDPVEFKLADVPAAEKLEKFLEDVKWVELNRNDCCLSEFKTNHAASFCGFLSFRYGIYPLTAFSAKQPPPTPRPRAISPETAESVKSASPEPLDIESRRVVNMICSVKPIENCNELLVSFEANEQGEEKLLTRIWFFLADDNTFKNGW
jgi:nuclear receptor-binding protein